MSYTDGLGTPDYDPGQDNYVDPSQVTDGANAMMPYPGVPMADEGAGGAMASGGALDGKGDWKDIVKKVGIGMGLGLLSHKLSGGKISFGEAMGHVGKGWADVKQKQNAQLRDQARKQYDMQVELVHQSLQDMKGLDLKKYPKLLELTQKFREGVAGAKDGHPLPPAKMTELMGLWATAQGELGRAKDESKTEETIRDAGARYEAQTQNEMKPLTQNGPAPGFVGPPSEDQGVGPNDARTAVLQGHDLERRANLPLEHAPDMMTPYVGNGPIDKKTVGSLSNTLLDHKLGMERLRVDAALREKGINMQAARENEQIRSHTLGDIVSIIRSQINSDGKASPEFMAAFNELSGMGGRGKNNTLGLKPPPQ